MMKLNNFDKGHAFVVGITILILLLAVELGAAIPEISGAVGIHCEICPEIVSSTVTSTSKISALPIASNVFSPFSEEYIVTGSEGGSTFYFPSDGNGLFGTKSVVYSARTVDGITIADFDNDGDLDFVLGDGDTDSIVLFRNEGGGINTPITVATNVLGNTPFFSQFRAADFNGDGKMDFIAGGMTTSPDRQFVFINLGNNAFAPSPIDVSWRSDSIFIKEVGDFNNDGKQDMLIGDMYGISSGKVFLYKGNGDGTFQTPVLSVNLNVDHNIRDPIGLAAGDFNLDGKLDVIVGGDGTSGISQGEFWLYNGNGDGTFTAETYVFNLKGLGTGQVGVDAFDFDKDGKSDVVGYNYNGGQLWYIKGNGDGTFEFPVHVESFLPNGVGIAAPPDRAIVSTTSPVITSRTPTSGVAGMAITINGKNFGKKPGSVLFGDTPANLQHPNGYFKWSDTQIVAQAPIGIGTSQVMIKTSKGVISNIVPFTYLDVPIASQWRWPRDEAKIGQVYNSPNNKKYHTGIDMYETTRNVVGPVFAAADGVVVAKCPNGQKCIGFSTNSNNHNMQGVVILAHNFDGTLVYSLYAHLSDVSSTPAPGEEVNIGDPLGITGVKAKRFGNLKHTHFEIKNGPVMHNPSWTPVSKKVYWGYTPSNPDNYDYRNPTPFINLFQPPVPTLISPANGEKEVIITPELSWNEVTETQLYRVQISKNKEFTDVVFDQSGLTITSVTTPDLSSNTLYWWRVKPRNAGGAGPWSDIWNFMTV